MAKVAVLVVHGIGWHDDGRDEGGMLDRAVTRLMDPPRNAKLLDEALAKRLDTTPYVLRLAHWGELLEPIQRRFEESYRDLRWDNLRRVMISALGDAAQYSAAVYSEGRKTFPAYEAIHGCVAKTLEILAGACGPEAPLVVIGHSLGGHILSNHIYDEQTAAKRDDGKRSHHRSPTGLETMQTLRGVVSLGCNIPLFAMGVETPVPIALERATWLNYYDKDDVLGFPLTPLYWPNQNKPAGYDLRDRRVEVGDLVLGSTPISHGLYWTQDRIVDDIAALVRAAARGEPYR